MQAEGDKQDYVQQILTLVTSMKSFPTKYEKKHRLKNAKQISNWVDFRFQSGIEVKRKKTFSFFEQQE